MVLLADNCGVVTFAGRMQKPELKLSRKGLGSGLVEFYLLNMQDDIISSRLIFNRSGYIYNDSVVSLPKGDYAVTSRKVVGDSLHNLTIVSELMLQSDIKGYIEEPDYYFTDVDSIQDRNLDNLLLTQGWKRYDIQNALKGKFEEPKEPIEVGGAITGTVYSRWQGKPLEGATVNALSTGVNFGGIAETDSNGKFVITGTDWPDGTYFALQAFNKNGNKEHNLEVDEDIAVNVNNLPETNSCEGYDPKLLENGAVWLKEVDVVAPKTAEEQHDVLLRALGVRSITAEDIKDNNYTTYDEILRKIPGLNIINGNLVSVSSRKLDGSRGLVEFWVDGHRWEPTFDHENPQNISGTFYEFTSNYPLHIVEKIQFYRPSGAMFLSNYASANAGAIAITTKNGSGISWDHNLFIKRVAPLGYQNLAEAYRPHFVYDPIEKVPTVTSFWYPRINRLEEIKSLNDADIVVEGITELGLPYRGVIKAKYEKE